MYSIEKSALQACHEVTVRQQEILPLLAADLAVPMSEILYTWVLKKCKQSGIIGDTDWRYFFHGLSCDIKNRADGRFLRVDFGPNGTTDTFTAFGVLQFVMTSVNPWPELKELKLYLAEGYPPYDQFSGSVEKICQIWLNLETHALIEKASRQLIELEAQYTTLGVDGIKYVNFPLGTPDKTQIDCSVANRYRLSAHGMFMINDK